MDLSGFKWPLIIAALVGTGWLFTSGGVNWMYGRFTAATPGVDVAQDTRDEAGLTKLAAYTYHIWKWRACIDIIETSVERYGQNAPNYWFNMERLSTYKDEYDRQCAVFLDQHLSAAYAECKGERLNRFRDAVDIMVGRKRRFDSLPLAYFYPGLPANEFFDKALFPWLPAFESATDALRNEFLHVLASEEGFTPYISYPEGLPLNQWVELNNSPRWSAFHLFKAGERLESNASRCPDTMALLDSATQPKQAGGTPAAMFSLLKPKTRIPPHTGVSNVRLVTHVPLIVPDSCGFRCGNQTRGWTPGDAFVFDDTIEYEAWNDSEKLRVVLIFDIWHPMLSEAEQRMISALSEGLNRFTGEFGGFDL